MGIHSKFESDFQAINLASMADDMLAQVVADHARDRFQPSNTANATVAGGFVPFGVMVDGRSIYRGQGATFPERQLALMVNPPGPSSAITGRRLPAVVIDWAWESLSGAALARALTGLVRIDKDIAAITNPFKFERALLSAAIDDVTPLLHLLLKRYGRSQYPEFFRRLDEARALYRVYRIVSILSGLLGAGGDKSGQADASVLAWIAGELRRRSPVLSGEYRDAHQLWGDGEFLMDAADVKDDTSIPDADEYSFTNTVPYARKIEIGKTKSGRDFVIQVPSHLYERTAQDAAQRFEGVAEISYEVRAVIGPEQTPQRHARRPHNKPDVRFPSIVVRFV